MENSNIKTYHGGSPIYKPPTMSVGWLETFPIFRMLSFLTFASPTETHCVSLQIQFESCTRYASTFPVLLCCSSAHSLSPTQCASFTASIPPVHCQIRTYTEFPATYGVVTICYCVGSVGTSGQSPVKHEPFLACATPVLPWAWAMLILSVCLSVCLHV